MSALLPTQPIKIDNVESNSSITVDDTGIRIIDNNDIAEFGVYTNNVDALRIDKFQRLGINTSTTLSSRLTISDPNGKMIKMINTANNTETEINVDLNGDLVFKTLAIEQNARFPFGFRVAGVQTLVTANQINYNKINVPGVAEGGKALVLNDDREITNIAKIGVEKLSISSGIILDITSSDYVIDIGNTNGKMLRMKRNNNITRFLIDSIGNLQLFNENTFELISKFVITSDSSRTLDIGFNTYNNLNNKIVISKIESSLTEANANFENSKTRFYNLYNGLMINTMTIDSNGLVHCKEIDETSDGRIKNIINDTVDTRDSLDRICKIKTYDYNFKRDINKKIHHGVIAQELKEIIPSAVNVSNALDEYNIPDLHTVSNKEITAYLIDSIKELNGIIHDMQDQIDKLKAYR